VFKAGGNHSRLISCWFLAWVFDPKDGDMFKKTVKDWFDGLVADFYDVGTQNLITRYDKCLNLHGD
jgi:hypothetical protein